MKKKTSFTLSEVATAKLKKSSKKLGVNKTAMLEIMIRQFKV